MRTILVVALMMLSGLAQSSLINQMFMYAPVVNSTTTVGHVMARAQVIGPNGGPILVKVRSSGSAGQSSTVEIEEIGEAYAGGPLDGVYMLSGSAYRDVLQQLAQLRARYPERMARAEFLPAQQLASGLPLADGSRSPGITLPDHIKTVVVWGRQDRLAPGTDAHIILTAPFQLDAGTALPEDVSSLLMNPDGSIRSLAHGSGVGGDSFNVESFTWRTAFYAQPGSTEQSDKRLDRINDQIFGPIALASLEQYGWFGAMHSVTDAEGQYGVSSHVLCLRNALGGYLTPGIESSLILTVPTVPFNPNRLGTTPYYELRYLFMPCSDDPALYRMDFLIDVLWLVGELHLSNTPGGSAIPVGSSVSYEGQDRSGEPTVRVWDYDGDGEADKAVLAHKRTITDPDTGESFVIPDLADDGGYQAVYFSSGDRVPPPKEGDIIDPARHVPDLWRLADRTLDGRPTGLLTEISEDALRHTDVYIFRESTGELLVEVSGLPEGPYAGRASRIENNAYLWHTLLRGRESVRNNFAAYGTASGSRPPDREDAFRERSAELGFSSRYQSRDADMPAPGEMLHVVAINRVTGYTGSVRFELGAANSPGGAQQRVPRLELLPPNVKVWAQRLTEIEAGLTAGEQREYLISHEGAHTANDLIVGLYTDWRAADGSPLPNALGQLRGADFGLTGRLAKVRDGQLVPVTAGQVLDSSITLEDALAAGSQGAVAEFPIGPGQNLQLLRLPNTETGGNEHYYVNLFGRALNKEVCSHCQYDQAGLHPTLAGRPNHFAPVFVPRFDRGRTDAERQAARAWAKENNESVPDTPAHHQWVLRPEYQFSQLNFVVGELVGVDTQGEERNLFVEPDLRSEDELIRILYSILLPEMSPLTSQGPPREYVLAFGEQEKRLTIGSNKWLEFSDLSYIHHLEPADFFTIRLFLLHDSNNVLWEYAVTSRILDGIEITQAIQDYISFSDRGIFPSRHIDALKAPVRYRPAIDLMAGGETALRVYFFEKNYPASYSLEIERNGEVVAEEVSVPANCSPRMQREAHDPQCSSFDITIGLEEGDNDVKISVYEKGNGFELSGDKEFVSLVFGSAEAKPLVIRVYKPCVKIYGDTHCNENYYSDAVDHMFHATKMLPYGFAEVDILDTRESIVAVFEGASEVVSIDHVRSWAIDVLEKMSEEVSKSVEREQIDGIVFGLAVWGEEVPESAGWVLQGRASGIPGNAMVMRRFDMTRGDRRALAMHEMGHLFGRHHVPGGGVSSCVPLPNAVPQWPYRTPHLHSLTGGFNDKFYEVGFDVMNMQPKVSPGHYEVMAYCNRQWVSPYTYNAIMNQMLR